MYIVMTIITLHEGKNAGLLAVCSKQFHLYIYIFENSIKEELYAVDKCNCQFAIISIWYSSITTLR